MDSFSKLEAQSLVFFWAAPSWSAGAKAGCATVWIDCGYREQRPSIEPSATVDSLRAAASLNRAYWKMVLRMYGWGRTA